MAKYVLEIEVNNVNDEIAPIYVRGKEYLQHRSAMKVSDNVDTGCVSRKSMLHK